MGKINLNSLTSGSAMMIRILRSESKVKFANKLLRTNSPGLLSGSTLTGAMTTGPFLSPNVPLAGGIGGFSPTGEAEKTNKIIIKYIYHTFTSNWAIFCCPAKVFSNLHVLLPGQTNTMHS